MLAVNRSLDPNAVSQSCQAGCPSRVTVPTACLLGCCYVYDAEFMDTKKNIRYRRGVIHRHDRVHMFRVREK
eukprot:3113060-Pyramimonas_sp.AAC.1